MRARSKIAVWLVVWLLAPAWGFATVAPRRNPWPGTGLRFAEPLAVEDAAVSDVPCAQLADGQAACLAATLAVIHRDGPAQEVLLDSVTYPLDTTLLRRVEEDFGAYALVALARLRRELVRLGPSLLAADYGAHLARVSSAIDHLVCYRLHAGVELSLEVEMWLSQLARAAGELGARPLVITSGQRFPASQARAMYDKLAAKARFRSLYRKRDAARDIELAYLEGMRRRHSRRQIVHAMAQVIALQVQQGVFVSAHLRDGAVDIRSRNLNGAQKGLLIRAARQFPAMRLIPEEKTPPHFHLEVLPETPPAPVPPPPPAVAPAGDYPFPSELCTTRSRP